MIDLFDRDVLDESIEHKPGSTWIEDFSSSDEVDQAGFDIITPKEYIAWVQRSLNRIYGSRMVTDGRITATYRELVKKSQSDSGLTATGEVDSITQNQIIKANERSRAYMDWVHTALECDSVFTDPARTSPNSKGSYKSFALKTGIKWFQKRQGLKQDGYVGSKTEIKLIKCCKCLPPGHKKKQAKPSDTNSSAPLNALQVKLLVWQLTGKRPEQASVGQLAVEFAKFVDLKKLLRKPTLLSIFKQALRVYWKTVVFFFKEEPRSQFGALMGGAYAVMDITTGRSCSRRLRSGKTRAQKLVASGFNKGYQQMCSHMSTLAADPDVKRLLKRLAANPRRNMTLGHIYRALHAAAISKAGGKSLIYLSARSRCQFSYPTFKSSCKV